MSNYNNSRNRYSNENGNNSNYRGESSRNANNNSQPVKKHSGAKLISWKTKDGEGHGISAWNFSASKGMISVFIAPYSKTGEVFKTKNNSNEYISMMAKIEYKNSGVEKHFPVLVEIKTNRVALPEMGWIINPNAKNGGYCGTWKKD